MEKTHFALSWWLRHHQNSKTIEGPDRNCCLTCYFLTTGQNKEKEMKVWWISALYQALFTPCLNLSYVSPSLRIKAKMLIGSLVTSGLIYYWVPQIHFLFLGPLCCLLPYLEHFFSFIWLIHSWHQVLIQRFSSQLGLPWLLYLKLQSYPTSPIHLSVFFL